MSRAFEVEICVDSAESAIEAEKLGADRVELCARLDLDGLTPSDELIAQTRDAISIGLHVIIRPREGGFYYSSKEKKAISKSINTARQLGADGIVAGALDAHGFFDFETTQRWLEASGNCSFTFHRAFDVCENPWEALMMLDALGADRVLSSGQEKKALEGADMLGEMGQTVDTLKIMAGSGVNASNVEALWQRGIRQFHFTSHKPNAEGVNVFDHEKMAAVMEILNQK